MTSEYSWPYEHATQPPPPSKKAEPSAHLSPPSQLSPRFDDGGTELQESFAVNGSSFGGQSVQWLSTNAAEAPGGSATAASTEGGRSAKPIAKRQPGETARGPDGKRRRKAGSAAEPEAEVIELSD